MALKDVLIILDASKHCAERVRSATSLAARFKAHLTGLYVMPALEISPFVADQFPPEALDEIHAQAAQQRDVAMDLFQNHAKAAGLATAWIEERGDATEFGIAHARRFDLTILGQPDPAEPIKDTGGVRPEPLMLGAGRPILSIPHGGSFESPGKRIVVAWNGSPQAVRAINDALPLLAAAEQVCILTIDAPDATHGPSELAARDILPHLERHGIAAEARHAIAETSETGDELLAFIGDEGMDLLVMGVYGHSRLRELALGGVSRHLLQHMTVPLFASH